MEIPEDRLRTAREQDPEHSWRGLISTERRGPPVPEHSRTVMWANGPGAGTCVMVLPPNTEATTAPTTEPHARVPKVGIFSNSAHSFLDEPARKAAPAVFPTSLSHHVH